MTSGGRNLFILGAAATVIALATTGISLALYHNSGDIYLDRSRPGFLPDKEETKPTTDDYTFTDSGEINAEVIRDYLRNLDFEIESLRKLEKPFDASSLSDEALGIPAGS